MSVTRPITKQPGCGTRIVVYLPAPYPSCPPGLEALIQTDHIFIKQGIHDSALFRKSKDKFEVLSSKGERIFLAQETTNALMRICCDGGGTHPFEMSIVSCVSDSEVLSINASPDCYGAWSGTISQNGVNIGFVNEDLYCCGTRYSVLEARGNEAFRIHYEDYESNRNNWTCFLCRSRDFEIYSCNRDMIVGRVSKRWEEEQCLVAETLFGLSFPRDISVRHKALLLGALFILNYNHFKT